MVRFESLGPAAGLRIVPALSRRRRLGLSGAATGLHCGQGPEGSGRRSDAGRSDGAAGPGRRARRTLSPGIVCASLIPFKFLGKCG